MSRNFRLPRLPPCRDVGSEGIRHCPPPAFARHLSFLARLLLATERVASPETVMDSVAVPADIAVIVDLSCDDRATSDSQNIFNTYREWADSLLSSLICKRKRPSVAVLWVDNVIGHLLPAYPDRADGITPKPKVSPIISKVTHPSSSVWALPTPLNLPHLYATSTPLTPSPSWSTTRRDRNRRTTSAGSGERVVLKNRWR